MSLRHSVKDATPDFEYSEIKRSRHNRRFALQNTWNMKHWGWHKLSGVEYSFLRAWDEHHPENRRRVRTDYNRRTRPTSVDSADWFKSPIDGVTPADIFSLAQLRYWNDPEEKYRPGYEMHLVLQMGAEEIQTELMILEMGLS